MLHSCHAVANAFLVQGQCRLLIYIGDFSIQSSPVQSSPIQSNPTPKNFSKPPNKSLSRAQLMLQEACCKQISSSDNCNALSLQVKFAPCGCFQVRERQLEQYQSLQSHTAAGGTDSTGQPHALQCDRCLQPVDEAFYLQNVHRMQVNRVISNIDDSRLF